MARSSIYPWEEWEAEPFAPFTVVLGKDITTSAQSFRAMLQNRADLKGRKVTTTVVREPGSVSITAQFYTDTKPNLTGNTVYPWELWEKEPFQAFTARPGVDFTTPAPSFRALLSNRAAQYGRQVTTTVQFDDDGVMSVVFCFYTDVKPNLLTKARAITEAHAADLEPGTYITCEYPECGAIQQRREHLMNVLECLENRADGFYAIHRDPNYQRPLPRANIQYNSESGPYV